MADCTFDIRVEVVVRNTLQLDVIISQEIQVVYDTTIEVEGRLVNQNQTSPQSFQNDPALECINVQKVYDWIGFCTDVQSEVSVPAECDSAILECRIVGGK